MKSRYSIGIFAACTAVMIVMTFIYRISYERSEQEYLSLQAAAKKQYEAVEAKGAAGKEEGYYLTGENGVVVIYLADKKTVYEHTSIKIKELPEALKRELQGFKKIPDLKSLYGFLENYSS